MTDLADIDLTRSRIEHLMAKAAALNAAGNWESAVKLYEDAFLLSAHGSCPANLLEATRRIGYAYQWAGDIPLAIEYLELAVTLASLNGEAASAGRALNGLGTIYQACGEVDLAERSYLEAQRVAESTDDVLAAGDIQQNLGSLATLRGEYTKAIAHYDCCRNHYASIGHERGLAQVLNNLALLHLDMGELDGAVQAIDAALSMSQTTGDAIAAASAHLHRAEVNIVLGAFQEARLSCEEALEIAGSIDDNRLRAEALKYYGTIYRSTDKPNLAVAHLRQAISLARALSLPLTEAEAQRELALVWRSEDRNSDALEALNRAHALFSQLQAKHEKADVTSKLAQLEKDFLGIVQLWSASIEEKDHYTRGHCQRVAEYACLLARSAGIPDEELAWFRMGAFLHDVGKMEIPEEILHKRGVLTAAERLIVERHTVNGDRLLEAIPFPWDIRPMVRSHHERWDGRGYPDGLVAEAIPLAARILRLADVFDALTTSRSYRQRLTVLEALELMREDRGAFDPKVFEQFERLFPQFIALAESASGDLVPLSPALASTVTSVAVP